MTQAAVIAEMIKRDDAKQWVNLLTPMINWMCSDKQNSVACGLDTFCTILNETDDRMHVILPDLIPGLYKLFIKANVTCLKADQS